MNLALGIGAIIAGSFLLWVAIHGVGIKQLSDVYKEIINAIKFGGGQATSQAATTSEA